MPSEQGAKAMHVTPRDNPPRSDLMPIGLEPALLEPAELHDALAQAQIQTLYQPIVRLADRRLTGFEVLARLAHPTLGTLLPWRFIPPMEAAGLSWPLTQAVMRRAFADWGDGRLRALGCTLSLNVPLDVVLHGTAMRALDAERASAGIAAGEILIELTESQHISRLPALKAAANDLRRAGYGLAIDDVGPAIRDHRALLDLPFTVLKLDKTLVQSAVTDAEADAFLCAALRDARQAGLLVTAEGLENTQTWRYLAERGVDEAQGFMIGHPMPSAGVAAWLADWVEKRRN